MQDDSTGCAMTRGTEPEAGNTNPTDLSQSVTVSDYVLDGLEHDVEIIIDTWGVPHIYAESRNDVYTAQGFNAARDRLFQIDLWRRRGNGLLAEVFGPDYVEQDRANRLFLYRGDMRAEWLSYSTATRAILTSFTEGVNAYISWALADSSRLPPEFELYGYEPTKWSPDDALRFRTHGLFYNVEEELARALTLRDFGESAEELRHAREPRDPLVLPDGVDYALLSDDILHNYRLAFCPVDFQGRAKPDQWREMKSGSNNWVISGTRTTTGRPILANDPHRALTLPSLRYLAHLEAPGISTIGAGEPALPGISIGHNGKVAFGLTIWPADQEDLYVYELNPTDDRLYRYGAGWERFGFMIEEVAVAGSTPAEIELQFTRHGPVIHVDSARGFAVAVRAAWLQPGTAPYLSSIEYQTASTADEFIEALSRWGAPGVNQVYATPDGDIGWKASALIPRRVGWDGSLPVPGDGRYEWNGFAHAEELPGIRNPEAGWFATANQMNLPDGFDNQDLTTTYDWYSYARYERLADWLSSNDSVSVDDSLRMQWDSVSVHGARLITSLTEVPVEQVRDGEVFKSLLAWDAEESVESVDALVFEIWLRRHLRPWLIESYLRAKGLTEAALGAARRTLLRDEAYASDLRGDIRMLDGIIDGLGVEVLSAGVDETLRSALEEIETLLGADRSAWSWGALLHTRFTNPAFVGMHDVPTEWKKVGPFPRAGSGDTVGMVAYGSDFQQTMGSTFRIVIDVGEWDNTRAANAPGQAGDPRSQHYSDLASTWAVGGSFPLLYSRAAVEANTEERIVLHAGRQVPVPPASKLPQTLATSHQH